MFADGGFAAAPPAPTSMVYVYVPDPGYAIDESGIEYGTDGIFLLKPPPPPPPRPPLPAAILAPPPPPPATTKKSISLPKSPPLVTSKVPDEVKTCAL